MTRTSALLVATIFLCACHDPVAGPSGNPPAGPLLVVNEGGQLTGDYELLVNTDRGRTDWLNATNDGLQATYPPGQAWGFVGAVLRGNTTLGSRPGVDLSGYRTLQMQLRGTSGGESVAIGIKDSTDADNGTETRKSVVLTTTWQTLSFNLSDFTTADKSRIYLLFEIVFDGAPARTVFFRDVRYIP